ncbi:MAG TPA: methyltransferase [Gammaproteobacteria bacterium]|nr:methyltransferase [Gammaproteobacteria bacterium]
MRLITSVIAAAFVLPLVAAAADIGSTPAYVTAALTSPARKDNAADDTRRQAATVMAFAGLKPGQSVLELAPGEGYWTRIFSGIVGDKGHVYAVWPNEMGKYDAKSIANWQGLVKQAPYTNVSVLQQPAASLSSPAPVDVVFTCQNYHDYHDKFMGPVDMAAFDKKVYDELKPGGVFLVIDHVANSGDATATEALHRIDPAVVRKEVEAAGFVFDGESDALKNPADDHTAKVFDPAIRGKTDQFIFRFRKPAK